MKKIVLFFLVSFLLAKAQPPTRFYTAFGGDGDDIAYSGKITLDKSYILAGTSSSWGTHGNTDVFLVKLDSMGQQKWQKFIGGTGNDVAKSVIQLPDSGYVLAGYTNSSGAGGYDALIVKTDKTGEVLWQTTFGGADWEFANDVVLAYDNNIVVVGYTYSFGAGGKDGFAIKLDRHGNLLWQKFFGGALDDELRSVIATNDHKLAAVGYTQGPDSLGDCIFLKLSLSGDTLFTRKFGGPYQDYANDVIQKQSGDYVICGAKTYSAGATTEAYMYSMYSNGVPFWENHNTSRPEDGDAFVSLSNSYYSPEYTAYVRPRPVDSFKMQDDIYIAPTYGFPLYVNASGGGEDEYVYSVEATPDGGYISVGYTESFDSQRKNIYFIKLDSTIINYVSVVGVPEINKEQNTTVLYNADEITINFLEKGLKQVSIYDLNGKTIFQSSTHTDHLQVNMPGYQSSLYVLRISFENGSVYNEKFIH